MLLRSKTDTEALTRVFHRVFRLLSFFGSRYIHKLELLPNSTVNVWTYDFVARPKVYTNVPIDAFRPSGYNDKGDYYKVKLRGYRWFFIMDKKGEIPYVPFGSGLILKY